MFWVGGRGRAGQEQEKVVHKVAGLAWAVWLGVFSVHGTGDGELGAFSYAFFLLSGGRLEGRKVIRGGCFYSALWVCHIGSLCLALLLISRVPIPPPPYRP